VGGGWEGGERGRTATKSNELTVKEKQRLEIQMNLKNRNASLHQSGLIVT
jgi:hypothetical protein